MVKSSIGILVLLLLSLSSIALAQSTATTAGGNKLLFSESACIDFFKLGWDNWRTLVVIGLLISATMVALFYMVGEMLRDSSVVARAKDDLFQLAATALIVLVIFSIVSIMCNDTISQVLLFNDKNLFESAGKYLVKAAQWTRTDMYTALAIFSSLNAFESWLDSDKWAVAEGFSESFGLFYDQAVAFFAVPFFAYISILLQLQVLYFVQPFALSIVIPLGIILRSFSPFRTFGGGLLGVGIALLVFYPFLIALDAVFLNSYFGTSVDSTDLICNNNQECLSKVCPSQASWTIIRTGLEKESMIVPTTVFGKAACAERGNTGDKCGEDPKVNGDWQCLSGRCDNGKCKDAAALTAEGGICSSNSDCREGLWCDKTSTQGICRGANQIWNKIDTKPDSTCTNNVQCGIPGQAYCSQTDYVCVPTVGPDEKCQSDMECASLYCLKPNNICSAGKTSESQIPYELMKSTPSYNPLSAAKIVSWIKSLINFFTLSILAGFVLPLINLVVIGRAMRDISGFLGSEIDLAKIYQVL